MKPTISLMTTSMILAVALATPAVSAEDGSPCVGTLLQQLACYVEMIGDTIVACVGVVEPPSTPTIAEFTGTEPYYRFTGGVHYVGIALADGGSGTGPLGGHNSFLLAGAVSDPDYCDDHPHQSQGQGAGAYWIWRITNLIDPSPTPGP